jgi:hypothetical protein
VAYRLALHASSVVCSVFHVSQLKKLVSNSHVSPLLPDAAIEYQIPKAVLGTMMKKEGGTEVTQVLIKWSQMGKELATWEDRASLQHKYLAAPAWGLAAAQDRGC